MKYAICNETFEGWDHARVCDYIAYLGYSGLEVAPFTLAPLITDVSAARRTELRRQAEAAGVTILGLHWLLAKTTGFYLNTPDAAVRQKTGDYLAALAQATADLGGTLMVLGSPLQRNLLPGITREAADGFTLDTLSRCLPALEQTGVTLCLEPLGPSETDYLNTAAHAVELIDRVGSARVRLHLDVKAMAAEVAPTPDVIRANAAHAFHFHANDPNRRGPGFGDTDFKPIFRALTDIDYRGWVSVEVFDYAPDPETIARDSIRYMRDCEP